MKDEIIRVNERGEEIQAPDLYKSFLKALEDGTLDKWDSLNVGICWEYHDAHQIIIHKND